jgi:thymidylate kinase
MKDVEAGQQSVRIFFEGPSCSGKSTLLSTLDREICTPVFKDWGKSPQSSVTFFLERDEDKLRRAKENTASPFTIVDRGYLSTLTYYQVLQEQKGVPAHSTLQWFIEGLGSVLYRPDYYVFLTVPPEVTVQRATTARTVDESNMWIHFPDRILYWYERLYQAFDSKVPRFTIDGTLSPTNVQNTFYEIIQKIQKEQNDEQYK